MREVRDVVAELLEAKTLADMVAEEARAARKTARKRKGRS
jgi:DNA-binding IscR family transcriptional regulator